MTNAELPLPHESDRREIPGQLRLVDSPAERAKQALKAANKAKGNYHKTATVTKLPTADENSIPNPGLDKARDHLDPDVTVQVVDKLFHEKVSPILEGATKSSQIGHVEFARQVLKAAAS